MDEFETLLDAQRGAVERFVRFRLNSKADADDVLQEVYLTAYQKFSQLKNKDSFKAWMISIARNKCNDYYRRQTAQWEVPIDKLTEKEVSCGKYEALEENAVRETLSLLTDKDKQILYLYFWREVPQSDIAKQLNIPLGTVKSRLYTAKQNFKNNYPYRTNISNGEYNMKQLPEFMPEYTIVKSDKAPFAVKWEELWGLFIVPKIGEKRNWGIYETDTKKCFEWGEMSVTGRAMVHDIEGVEIKEYRHNHFGDGKDDADHYYIAQLTNSHCRILAENYMKNGIRKYLTFLDGDSFMEEWGYGESNCGKEIDISASGKIIECDGKIMAQNTNQLCDIVGRYTVTISGKVYDTVRVLSLNSYYGDYVGCEQYLDENGRTVLWRRFNRDDWAMDRYPKRWSEQLPENDKLTVNGMTYVHWYDCITDYIL